ncbi:MAG: COX15/CtaA family protein [Egibacteraceae bacterium]
MASQHPTGFGRLAVVTAGLSLVLVALGGAVRATDSGLACPDWPRCFGLWIPPADLNIWLEHSHRLLAGVVAIAIAVLTVWALARFRTRPAVVWASVTALVLVTIQAGLGALVVLRLLRADLVTAHLGMAMVVVACLIYLAVAVTRPAPSGSAGAAGDRRLAWTATAVAGLCFAQILVGGHVTGIGAGLVYPTFPLMDGALIPAIGTEREAFHVAHRLLAYLLAGGAAYLVVAALRHRRTMLAAGAWGHGQRWLLALPLATGLLVVVQIVLGVANLYNGTSFLTVIPHLAVASWIWATLVLHVLLAHGQAASRSAAAPTPSPTPRQEAPA